MSTAEEYLRRYPGGVKEAVKSEGGRKALEHLQQKHWKDILQPSDPRYKQVWGKKQEKIAQDQEKKVKMAKEERAELSERRLWKAGKKTFL